MLRGNGVGRGHGGRVEVERLQRHACMTASHRCQVLCASDGGRRVCVPGTAPRDESPRCAAARVLPSPFPLQHSQQSFLMEGYLPRIVWAGFYTHTPAFTS